MKVKIQKPTTNGALIPLALNAFLLAYAGLSYNSAIEKGLVATVAPIAGAYPTLFAVLSFFVFKDRLKKKELLGILITLIGIVLLAFFEV